MGFWDAVASAGPYANNLHPVPLSNNCTKKNNWNRTNTVKVITRGWVVYLFLQPSVYMCLFTEVIFYSANKIPDNSDRCICQHICQKQT